MERFKIVLLAALLAATTTVVAKEPARRVYDLRVVGDIEINPDGAVRDYRLSSELPAAVAEPVDRSVRKWRFEPVVVDGRAVIARTRLNMTLTVEPMGGNYQLRIAHVSFGDPLQQKSSLKPPQYPREAAMVGVGSKVILAVKLDAQGNVVAAHPYQTSLTHRASTNVASAWRKRFEQASIQAAMDWKFDLTESIDGRPVDSIALIPIEYMPPMPNGAVDHENKWQAYVPGPINPLPWAEDGTGMAAVDPATDKDPRSMNSRFRLKGDAVGKLL